MSNIKEYTQSDILNKLPKSWKDITLEDFINKILTIEIDEEDDLSGYENSISIASTYLNLGVDIIKEFPMVIINSITQQLSFLAKKPEPLKNPKYRPIKNIEEYDYDTFVLFIKVSEQLNKGDYSNFPLLVTKATKDKIELEEVNKLSMDEVETLFFFLKKALKRYLNYTSLSLMTKLVKIKTKEKIRTLFKKT